LAVNLRYPLQKLAMSEIEKSEQEKEFDAWGLSKILVRNIVVGFIICLLSAIAYLSATIRTKESLNKQLQCELIICKEDATRQVERLKDQQIKLMEQISAIYEKQVEVERNVQATVKKLRNLDK